MKSNLLNSTFYQIIRTARPRQWVKNFSLFAAVIFSGRLFIDGVFIHAINAFFAFSFLASGVYFLNDIVDVKKDRLHPIKSNRPIASNKLSIKQAKIICFLLITFSLLFSYLYIGSYFFYILILYLLIQFSYSFYFRNIIILDSLVVASGFIIRVFAGGLATETSVSSWLVLTTIGISLLLAFGKRRSEKTILAKFLKSPSKADTRKTLRHYPDTLLDSMISIASSYTLLTYSLFTFQDSPQLTMQSLGNFLPSILQSPKWMMLTIPIVIYGVARYLYVIYEKGEGESPERTLLKDKPLFYTVLIWGISIMFIIYLIPLLG